MTRGLQEFMMILENAIQDMKEENWSAGRRFLELTKKNVNRAIDYFRELDDDQKDYVKGMYGKDYRLY